MPDPLLGELMPVLLRDVWPDESASFTPEMFAWLLKYFMCFDAVFRPIVKSL